MRTFTLTSDFGSQRKLTEGADLVIRNQIGRAVPAEDIALLRKFGHHISVEGEQATAEARDQDIRDFMGLNLEENIGDAINAHFKKVLKAQYN